MRRVLSLAAVFLLGVLLALAAPLLTQLIWEPPLPTILRDLPQVTTEVHRAWDERLAREFPPGTSQATLIAKLSSAGFAFHESDGRLWASFETPPFICQDSYSVAWTVGDGDAIQTVDGSYHLSCL
jgi:hypothetical protein